MKNKFLILIMVILFILTGCEDKTTGFSKTVNKGKINTINYSNIEIIFPGDALAKDAVVKITKKSASGLPENTTAVTDSYAISISEPLQSPVLLTVYFAPSGIPDSLDSKNLAILKKQGNIWESPNNQLIYMNKNKIMLETSEFTEFVCIAHNKTNNLVDKKNIAYSELKEQISEDLQDKGFSKNDILSVVEISKSFSPVYDITTKAFTDFITSILSDITKSTDNTKKMTALIKEKISRLSNYQADYQAAVNLSFNTDKKEMGLLISRDFANEKTDSKIFRSISDWINKEALDHLTKNLDSIIIPPIFNPRDQGTGNIYFISTIKEGIEKDIFSFNFLLYFHNKKINKFINYGVLTFKPELQMDVEAVVKSGGTTSFGDLDLKDINVEELSTKIILSTPEAPTGMQESSNAWISEIPYPPESKYASLPYDRNGYMGTRVHGFTFINYAEAAQSDGKLINFIYNTLIFENSAGASNIMKSIATDLTKEQIMSTVPVPQGGDPSVKLEIEEQNSNFGDESFFYHMKGDLSGGNNEQIRFHATVIIFRTGPVLTMFNSLTMNNFNQVEINQIVARLTAKIQNKLGTL